MLIPHKWLTSRRELASHLGAAVADEVLEGLVEEAEEAVQEANEQLQEDCKARVRGVIKRAAKRILAARRALAAAGQPERAAPARKVADPAPNELELLRRLERQIRAGTESGAHAENYDPKQVDHILSLLDIARCK